MRNQHRWLVGSLVALAMSGAWAQSGRINFAGAVVEPTCSTEQLAPAMSSAATDPAGQRLGCGHRAGADVGPTFTHEVVDLTTANRGHDRLLDYFASYAPVAPGGKVMARLVTRTYD
ncbi:hypothetical protein IMW82_09635 [Rhodanobacter sp. B2A1Ga4]|uniref:hypothetical protein n=1 Tax=Rhodanobacter TaxID=75309 RepID=UPI00131F1175|nr:MULTISPECIES: hypothetical protein [Rhodanobacter]MBQ4854929.1 hypothetical protein [Rhodanobacter sp. B2A1Ga4]